MSERDRADAAAAIAAHVSALPVAVAAKRVAAYVSTPSEPGTALILADLANRDVEVIVPVVQPDQQLDWVHFDPQTLVRSALGIEEPAGTLLGRDAIATADLVLVPALSVDHRGSRLGRGAGCYDRALARTSAPTAALLFDGEIIDELADEPHDVPVSMAITPSGVFRVPS